MSHEKYKILSSSTIYDKFMRHFRPVPYVSTGDDFFGKDRKTNYKV